MLTACRTLRCPLVYFTQVRKAASELVEGLTGSLQGIEKLLGEADRLLPALLRLLGDDRAISKSALTSLVNLTQVQRRPTQRHLIPAQTDAQALLQRSYYSRLLVFEPKWCI
jgi:3-polyprenyl-4-hydroxybenzoate decarboxylase